MKEYIKKFESASSADNYAIVDIPFTTSITTNPIQNLRCNQENKKIVVDGQGNASVVDAEPPVTIPTFTLEDEQYQFETGMTWADWIDSEYYVNPPQPLRVTYDDMVRGNQEIDDIYWYVFTDQDNRPVNASEEIEENGEYYMDTYY